jgi:glutamine synthetase
MIYAGLYGITNKLALCEPADVNLYSAGADILSKFEKLPENFKEACEIASSSDFIKTHIPSEILKIYCGA